MLIIEVGGQTNKLLKLNEYVYVYVRVYERIQTWTCALLYNLVEATRSK